MRVTGLHYYPLKSCRGIAVAGARVTPLGLEQDRAWMVVGDGGGFVTQRVAPAMARIEALPEGGALALGAPGMPALRVRRVEGDERAVTLWGQTVPAWDQGESAARWLSAFLGMPVRLVAMGPRAARPVDPACDGSGSRVAFSDGFPFLLISEASLEGLNRRLDRPLAMARFRPNIVVAGCPPHAEDGWRRLRIGELTFRVVKPCSRCAITTVDPERGEFGKEPLRTLAGYRRGEDGKVYFGQNLVHETREGRLRVGDPVTVLD